MNNNSDDKNNNDNNNNTNNNNQSEGFERIIQVPGCDDGTGLGHDKNLVSVVVVVVARLGAALSIAYI